MLKKQESKLSFCIAISNFTYYDAIRRYVVLRYRQRSY